MKNLKYSLFAGVFFLAACGPSAEEQAKEQQRIADSAAAAEQVRIQDSLAQAEKMYQDSIALAAQRTADSLRIVAVQDSINKAGQKPRSTPKPKTPKTQDEVPTTPKPGQGRG